MVDSTPPHSITFREALVVWCRVAALSFGGPTGQIAVMHRILVEEKRWISEERFLHALNYCMLLPGPEAQQLATYIGWLLHGVRGGLAAGCLFVLPGFLSILGLSVLYAYHQSNQWVTALFFGLKAAVLAIVVEAVLRIGRKVLKNNWMRALALAAFIAIFFFQVPFPVIIVCAGAVGFLGGVLRPDRFCVIQAPQAKRKGATETEPVPVVDHAAAGAMKPSAARSARTAFTWLVIWLGPVIVLRLALGPTNVLAQQAQFFSKAAVVTFGGAYSVLAYVAQKAVDTYGWLQPGEMLDGLAMAETTPGPLIQVVQFVGFMGAFRNGGEHPLLAGVLGSLVTTHVTYAPCFLWIFLGAPYIEYLRGRKLLAAALSSITAAVVGVVLNLAAWFGLHTLFSQVHGVDRGPLHLTVPIWSSWDGAATLITAVAALLLLVLHWGMVRTLALCAFAGIAIHFAFRT